MRKQVMEEEGEEPVLLQLFAHQVSGHEHMFKYDETTVCKPLNLREHQYYITLPEEMKTFSPEYRGVVEVVYEEDSNGLMKLVGYPKDPVSKSRMKYIQRTPNAGNSPGSSGEGSKSDSDSEQSPKSSPTPDMSKKNQYSEQAIEENSDYEEEAENLKDTCIVPGAHNPWSIRCHKRSLDKLRRSENTTTTQKFILLENVVSHYECPSILDLKMGPRQHGDDESPEKKLEKRTRCETTTSINLGVRLGGMQVYQVNGGGYICKNKYFGRTLKGESGFKESLYAFLNNGVKLRMDIIDVIVEKLRQLHALIMKQNTFRYYSSSLMIIYEGKCEDSRGKVSPVSKSRKTAEEETAACHRPRSTERKSEQGSHGSPHRSRSRENCHKDLSASDKVTIRMIDFAHSTHQGFQADGVRHTGPDKGYLFGLEKLIKMFMDIKQTHSSSS